MHTLAATHVEAGAHTLTHPFLSLLPPEEQVPGEDYSHGRRLRVYVVAVRREVRGLQVVVSRTHPGLVEKLPVDYYGASTPLQQLARSARQ